MARRAKEKKSASEREGRRERRGENRRGDDNVAVTRNETKRKCMRTRILPPESLVILRVARNCVETSFGGGRPRRSERGALNGRITR